MPSNDPSTPYGGTRTTHQLQDAAEASLVASGTINELVNHALGYLENYHENLSKNMLEAAYINYWHGYLIITRCIPDHPDYGKFSARITSPFYETYVDLIELITKDQKVQELETMINERASKAKRAMTSNNQYNPRNVPRKPVGGSANNSTDDLTARFERLRVPNGPRQMNGHKSHEIQSSSISKPIAPPPSIAPPPAPQPKSSPIVFPKTTVINAETLLMYLKKTPQSILLLDVRSRYEFDKGHITSPNVVCVEPIILRPHMNDQDLEDAMILNPEFEQRSFACRDSYDLVVYYDANSTSYNDGPNAATLQNLLHSIYQHAFAKRLVRPPCILAGGFETWVDDFEGAHITVSTSQLATRRPQQYKAPDAMRHHQPQPQQQPQQYQPETYPQQNYHHHHHQQQQQQQQKLPYPNDNEIIKDINGYFKAPAPPQYYHTSYSTPSTPPLQSLSNGSAAHPMPNYATRPAIPNNQQPSSTMSTQGADVILTQSNQLRIAALEFTTGLQNLGNTCYMNCIIQCLAGTPAISIMLVDGSYKRYVNVNSRLGYRGMLVQKFAELVQTLFRGNVAYVGPTALKNLSGRLRDTFRGSDQQDCQEFLTFILDGLHEDLNVNGDKERLKELTEAEERKREGMSVRLASTIEWERYLKSDYSPIVDTMQGQYQSQLKCLTCGTTSTTYNVFSFLSLPIPLNYQTVSLRDCFDLFTQDEILDNDNAWFCPKCKKPQRSVKNLRISRLPQVLIVHLKRFQQRAQGTTNKLETFVTYPTNNLNLTDYWPTGTGNDEAKLSKMPRRGQTPPFQYDLYGVANHFGTLKGGHYTAFVRKGSQGWCYFDDVRISRGIANENIVNQHAYVLFYQRRMRE